MLTCILNQKAGSNDAGAARAMLARVAAERGQEARVLLSAHGAELPALAAEARAAGGVVVAGGGDGTIAAVAAALVDTDVTLGVLPLGTLNHFAKDLGIPLDLEAAVRTLFAGNVARVDVGEVNGRIFLNNSSIGFYPQIVRERERLQRHGTGKWVAVARAAAADLPALAHPRRRARRRRGPAADASTPPSSSSATIATRSAAWRSARVRRSTAAGSGSPRRLMPAGSGCSVWRSGPCWDGPPARPISELRHRADQRAHAPAPRPRGHRRRGHSDADAAFLPHPPRRPARLGAGSRLKGPALRTIVHLSDLHFGRIDPAIPPALLRAVAAAAPDLVVVSGDFTQRARVAEFEAAASFLAALPRPLLTVPGNHDVPLYDVMRRWLSPLGRYRRYIASDLAPFYQDARDRGAGRQHRAGADAQERPDQPAPDRGGDRAARRLRPGGDPGDRHPPPVRDARPGARRPGLPHRARAGGAGDGRLPRAPRST